MNQLVQKAMCHSHLITGTDENIRILCYEAIQDEMQQWKTWLESKNIVKYLPTVDFFVIISGQVQSFIMPTMLLEKEPRSCRITP